MGSMGGGLVSVAKDTSKQNMPTIDSIKYRLESYMKYSMHTPLPCAPTEQVESHTWI